MNAGRLWRWLAAAVIGATAAGCADLGYYLQSASGQMELIQARRPIEDVLADPATSDALRSKLERVVRLRSFATSELKLPDNGSYRSYADVQRPFVVWNVFAADEFSVEPKRWCFPIAGCVGYRGYFSRERAEQFAAGLREQGYDVLVSGVPAYSTLGWFDDPVLNTFVNYPEYELAGLLFHELAHKRVYVRNDSKFNESFAVTVERAGVERWIAHNGDATMRQAFAAAQTRREQFLALLEKYRDRLAALYRETLPVEAMRARKAQALEAMRTEYAELEAGWNGYAGYDRFFTNLNNALLASVAIYSALVPQFERLLAKCDGDLAAFYAAVEKLAALPEEERAALLGRGAGDTPPAAR